MICIVQRVLEASVAVDGQVVGRIGPGMLVLAAVQRDDTPADVTWTANKLAAMRIFRAGEKHFDQDVKQVGGSILLISNFTVAAMTRHGRRPSFDHAADQVKGKELFDVLLAALRGMNLPTETGVFGGDMRVASTNDGPATFIVESTAARPDPRGPPILAGP